MRIWPAIDLRGGRAVRLEQGDFERETVFGHDPLGVARAWVEQGAERLHLVDLDGARSGESLNLPIALRIAAEIGVPCQFGGGVRDDGRIAALLAAGFERVVVGTTALRDPAWFRGASFRHPRRLALGLDARDGRVAASGWLETSSVTAIELARQFRGAPLAAVVYTDIARDGMLSGPNFEAIAELIGAVNLPVVASGGVTTAADIARLAALGCEGCIVGRSLYEGRLTLGEALEAARGAPTAPA